MARDAIFIVIKAGTAFTVASLRLAAGGGTKSIEFSGKLSLRLDEAATVVAHWLVASFRVLGGERHDRCNQNHDQKDGGEDGVVNKEDDAKYSGDNALFNC